MEEIRVDMRQRDVYDLDNYEKHEELVFKLNHTMPGTDEYQQILNELFEGRMGEESFLRAPLAGDAFDKMTIGNRVLRVSIPPRAITSRSGKCILRSCRDWNTCPIS